MALKLKLTPEEKYGLTSEEVKIATKWLRQHKTAGVIPPVEAAKLFEMFLLGDSLIKIHQLFPQYPHAQIAFTAAYKQWYKEREKLMHTLKDRVQAKVVKSVLDQVDFLTSMMAVANAEHLQDMIKYCQDPVNNPKPALRVQSIKDYKEIADTLSKLVTGVVSNAENKKMSPLMGAMEVPKLGSGTKGSNKKSTEAVSEDVEITIMDVE